MSLPDAGFNLVEFATRRRVTVAMVTLSFVLFGLIALGGLKVNLLPDLSYPTLTVRTEYTGALIRAVRRGGVFPLNRVRSGLRSARDGDLRGPQHFVANEITGPHDAHDRA